MSRAVVFHGPDRPLTLRTDPLPEAAPGEVLVSVLSCTLCRSDLHTYHGNRREPTPLVLGHEIVGRIAAFGPQSPGRDARGRSARVGDRITWSVSVGCGICFFCTDELPQKCVRLFKYGHQALDALRFGGGGLADHVLLVPGTAWYVVPEPIPDDVAALANCAVATVAAVLQAAGSVQDKTVLILGAGVLGLTACAMARSAGARLVLAVDPQADCRNRAVAFGATHTNDAEAESLQARVAETTEGRGVDVALELSGSAFSTRTALDLVRIGGTVVLAGTVAPTGPIPLDPERIVRRMSTIRGVHNYHPRDLAAALDFLAGPGRAFPFDQLIAASFPLEEAAAAFAHASESPGVRVAVHPRQERLGPPGAAS